jgi:hypothetical protein
MKKKFFTGLAPLLLVIAACVMTPAPALGSAELVFPSCTAPACPHVYKNGTPETEGKKLRGIAWGTLTLKNTKLGETTCHNIFAGFGVNPAGGGRAEGKVQAFYPYECEDPTCAGGGGTLTVTAGKTLPWTALSEETAAKEFFGKVGFKGPTENKKANPLTEPGQAEFNINCTTIGNPDFFGVGYTKQLNNGITIGTIPGEAEIQPEEVNAALWRNFESELFEAGRTETKTPKLKGIGYGGQEQLEVHNP